MPPQVHSTADVKVFRVQSQLLTLIDMKWVFFAFLATEWSLAIAARMEDLIESNGAAKALRFGAL